MGEGNVFNLSTPGGGYPGQVQMGGIPARGGGVPGDHSQARSGQGTGYPRARSEWGLPLLGGTPQVRSGWGVPLLGVPPLARSGWEGYPGYPPPGTGQHMEYLTSDDRYASYVHAGGLSCLHNTLVTQPI